MVILWMVAFLLAGMGIGATFALAVVLAMAVQTAKDKGDKAMELFTGGRQ